MIDECGVIKATNWPILAAVSGQALVFKAPATGDFYLVVQTVQTDSSVWKPEISIILDLVWIKCQMNSGNQFET